MINLKVYESPPIKLHYWLRLSCYNLDQQQNPDEVHQRNICSEFLSIWSISIMATPTQFVSII